MSYVKNDWTPSSSGTPVMATPTKFNHFEQGIYDNSLQADKVPQLRTDTDSLILAEKVENGQRASLSVLGYSCPKLSDTVYDYVSDNVLHKKVGRVDLGSLSWAYDSAKSYFSSNPLSNPKLPTSNWEVLNNVCSKFTSKAYQSIYNGEQDNTFAIHSSGAIWVRSTSYTSASTFKSAMQGTYLYYELSTEQTYSVLDNNALDSVGTCTNLLKPSLASGTYYGVTLTSNGDGIFTLSGTVNNASASYGMIDVCTVSVKKGISYRLVGCPSGGDSGKYRLWTNSSSAFPSGNRLDDIGNGKVAKASADETVTIQIQLWNGQTFSNATFKPMLTTNLSAQYSDYVPFTGTSGRLNSDVAEIKAELASSKTPMYYLLIPTISSDQKTNFGLIADKLFEKYSEIGLKKVVTFIARSSEDASNPKYGFASFYSSNEIHMELMNHNSITIGYKVKNSTVSCYKIEGTAL